MADRKVKAPAVVYVLMSGEGSLLGVMCEKEERGDFLTCASDSIHRYRLDTPKPAAKKRKAKR